MHVHVQYSQKFLLDKNFSQPSYNVPTYMYMYHALLKYSNYAHAVKGHHSLLLGSVCNNALTQDIKLVTSFSPCFIFQV